MINVSSTSFNNDDFIPLKYVCTDWHGQNISPNIKWTISRSIKVQSYALICIDPDIPDNIKNKIGRSYWVHWILYNLQNTNLKEGIKLASNNQVANDSGNIGYSGPCPPKYTGRHRYHFYVYALDTILPTITTLRQFETLINKHKIAVGQLIGIFPYYNQ